MQIAPTKKMTESGVIVKGIENLLIRLSRCCNPVPGMKLLGLYKRTRGFCSPSRLSERTVDDDAQRPNY